MIRGGNSPAVINMTADLQSMQNTPGTYYASLLVQGHVDLWARSWQWIWAHREGDIKYGNEDDGAGQYHGTGVHVGDGPGGVNLLVAKIGIEDGNDTLRLVANPDLSQGLEALETALDAAPVTDSRDISNGDASNFAQFSRAPGRGITYFDELRFATSLTETINAGGTPPEPSSDYTWKSDASGDWNERGSWSPSGVPNGIVTGGANPGPGDETATFGDAITTSQTVFTNSDVKVASIMFDNASSSYIIAGAGSVTLQADSGSTNLTVSQGSHEFQARVGVGANTTADVAGGAAITFTNTLSLNGNTLIKTGDGTLSINNNLDTGGSGSVDCQAGTCNGAGTVGDLINSGGVVAPGSSTAAAASAVPEPGSLLLLVLAVGTVCGWHRRYGF